jgi:stress response protein YsnF
VEITKPDRPRIQLNKKKMSVNDEPIGKSIKNHSKRCTLRVQIARVLARSQNLTTNSQRILRERAQLIHDKETGKYLNYRELLKDPKHAKL